MFLPQPMATPTAERDKSVRNLLHDTATAINYNSFPWRNYAIDIVKNPILLS